MNTLFLAITKRRNQIVSGFKLSYILGFVVMGIGTRSLYLYDSWSFAFYEIGVMAGKASLLLYILTVLPGVARRLRWKQKIFALLMVFRRYIGILMFVAAFMHYWFVQGVEFFIHGNLPNTIPLFLVAGFIAFYIAVPLGLTSNDFSVNKLGLWWNRIHSLTYILMWAIFAHVALQRLSIWTVLMGVTTALQLAAFAKKRMKKPALNTTPTPTNDGSSV